MVRGANTVNGHQRRIQLSGSGPDDAFGVAEPRLQIARAEVPLTANLLAVSFEPFGVSGLGPTLPSQPPAWNGSYWGEMLPTHPVSSNAIGAPGAQRQL
jgi:hypothetical protein